MRRSLPTAALLRKLGRQVFAPLRVAVAYCAAFSGRRNPLTETYQLFQYDRCPFCRRVLQFMKSAGIDIETRDTLRDPEAFRELVRGGGRSTVPCLKIESEEGIRWLYESADIIAYLRERFPAG